MYINIHTDKMNTATEKRRTRMMSDVMGGTLLFENMFRSSKSDDAI